MVVLILFYNDSALLNGKFLAYIKLYWLGMEWYQSLYLYKHTWLVVTVVPAFLLSPLLRQKKSQFFDWKTIWIHHLSMTTLRHFCHTVKWTISQVLIIYNISSIIYSISSSSLTTLIAQLSLFCWASVWCTRIKGVGCQRDKRKHVADVGLAIIFYQLHSAHMYMCMSCLMKRHMSSASLNDCQEEYCYLPPYLRPSSSPDSLEKSQSLIL